jgi:hypothetical protein
MSRRSSVILAVLILLATAGGGACLGHLIDSAPAASVQAKPEAQRVQTVNGEARVAVALDVQGASGIGVAPLVPSTVHAELAVYASVIDLQPLFDLGARLATARADRDSIRTQSEASRAQYERSQLLYQDDQNVSLKTVQDARTAAQADQARLRAAETALSVQDANGRQQLGDVLKDAAADPASGLFRRLSEGRAAVVRVTVPSDANLPPGAHIAVDGPGSQRLTARKLSAAPQTDIAVQGTPYFYLIEQALPSGTRMIGHVATDDKDATGLLIPADAIVWYGGQRWAYVRVAADHFTRRLVAPDSVSAQGVITRSRFRAGDMVVIRGAQLLLSEEQRPQGIATVCKDPPECDD